MTKVLSFAIQKGGSGKTTSVTNIGSILAKKNQRVLIISFEPQGNVAASFSNVIKDLNNWPNIYDIIVNKKQFDPSLSNVFKQGRNGTLDVIIADADLNKLSVELSTTQDIKKKYHSLRIAIEEIKKIKEYDYILIDIDPQANELMINAIVAADEIMVPLKTGIYDSKGLPTILEAIEGLNEGLSMNKTVGLIFPTMINKVSTKTRELWGELKKALDQNRLVKNVATFDEGIPQNIEIQSSIGENGLPASLANNINKKTLGKGILSYKVLVEKYILDN